MNQKTVFVAFLLVPTAMQKSNAFTAGIGNVGLKGRKRELVEKVGSETEVLHQTFALRQSRIEHVAKLVHIRRRESSICSRRDFLFYQYSFMRFVKWWKELLKLACGYNDVREVRIYQWILFRENNHNTQRKMQSGSFIT